jgi:hypothetical protein
VGQSATTGQQPLYDVRVVPREGWFDMPDDWHATITRKSDGKQAIVTASWLWLLRWRTRRIACDRMFRRIDRHDRKIAQVKEFSV